MKSKEYIEQMNNIKPSEDLINRTIKNIQHINNAEKNMKKSKLKAVIIGTITTLGLCAGTVGAYVAISGNTEILEKIGIHLSKNYEENSQNTNSILKGEGFKAELLSAGIDNSNLVLELKLNLDNKYSNTLVEDLKVKNIEIKRPSRPDWSSEYIQISQNQNISEMEDGNYKLFKYINVKDANLGQAGFWDEMFAEDENVKVIVTFDGLYGRNNKLLEEVKDNNKLEVELARPTNLIDTQNEIVVDKTIKYKNVRAMVQSIQPATFGNIILINVYEKDVDWNKINTIQKIDFDIKDKEGNKVKIISRTENLTLGKYNRKDGDFHEIGLEVQLSVDDKTVDGYDISLIEGKEVKVSSEKIKKQREDMLNDMKINNYEPVEEEETEEDIKGEQSINEYITKSDVENELLSGNVQTTQVYKRERLDNIGAPQYIIFDGKRCFIGEYEDMANDGTIILGDFKVKNNIIEIVNYDADAIRSQEYGFFTAASMKLEDEKIVVYDENEEVYYNRISPEQNIKEE